jgi:hypothetical protein
MTENIRKTHNKAGGKNLKAEENTPGPAGIDGATSAQMPDRVPP